MTRHILERQARTTTGSTSAGNQGEARAWRASPREQVQWATPSVASWPMNTWDSWAIIRSAAARIQGVDALDAVSAESIAKRFAREYVEDAYWRWWWDSVRPEVERAIVEYGDEDAWDVIEQRAPRREAYVLLVTDEEPEPKGAVRGSLVGLRSLVSESPYFEYVVTDDKTSFGIFDTHHNTLVDLRQSR